MIGLNESGWSLGCDPSLAFEGARILVVEDEPDFCEIVAEVLRLEGFVVTTASDGKEALSALEGQDFDLVITDIVMPRMDGLELILQMRKRYPDLPVAAMSGGSEMDSALYLRMARHFGVVATMTKPFGADQLLAVVRMPTSVA